MKRSNALVVRWLGIQLAGFAGTLAVLLLVIYFLLDPGNDVSVGMYTGILAAVGPLCALMVPMTLVTTLFPLALSFGATRRGFFGAIQLAKPAAALLFPLSVVLLGLLDGLPEGFSFLSALCSGLFITCFGELMGAVCIRFGQKGMWLFILLCALGGAAIGLLSSLAAHGSAVFLQIVLLFFGGGWPMMAGLLALGAVCTAASWAILRRAEA